MSRISRTVQLISQVLRDTLRSLGFRIGILNHKGQVMKKQFTTAIVFLAVSLSAEAIEVRLVEKQNILCESRKTVYIDFPAGADKVTYPIWTSFYTSKLSFIDSSISYVEISASKADSLEKNCLSQENWFRASSVSPGGNKEVIAIQNNECTYSRPKNGSLLATVKFGIAYREDDGSESEEQSSAGYFYYLPGSKNSISIENQNKRKWNPASPAMPKISIGACLDILAR